MSQVGDNQCGNCQFWNGPRKVGVFKTKAEVRGLADKGTCMNTSCPNKRREMIASYNLCKKYYVKWDQLK